MTSQLRVDRISPANNSEIIIDGLEHRNKNLILNGAMTVSQRGGNFDKSGHTLDRWYVGSSGYNISRGTAPHQFDYSLKCTRPTADNHFFHQRIELDQIGKPGIFKQGEEFTVSCWVKGTAGAEFLARMYFSEGWASDETPDRWNDAPTSNRMTLTGGWDRYERTFSVDKPCNPSHNSVCLMLVYYGTAVNQSVWFTGVQVEKGSMATEFEHETFSETLEKCKRFYQKSYPYELEPASNHAAGQYLAQRFGGTSRYFSLDKALPVEMRAEPTVVVYDRVGNSDSFNEYNSSINLLNVSGYGGYSSKTVLTWLDNSNTANDSDKIMAFHWTAEAEL